MPDPLLPNDFHILFVLGEEPKHGYRIAREIEALTGGAVRLEAANLHRTVQKLIRNGLVELSADRPPPERDDPRRRYYALTPAGRRALAAEALRMQSLAHAAEERKLIPRARRAT
jgi:DNA-binding PadR family transcriptional regulator